MIASPSFVKFTLGLS